MKPITMPRGFWARREEEKRCKDCGHVLVPVKGELECRDCDRPSATHFHLLIPKSIPDERRNQLMCCGQVMNEEDEFAKCEICGRQCPIQDICSDLADS